MNPLLSLIIPFYNVDKYIAQCLASVYEQNLEECLYEVICVNDGSLDNSRSIVLEYQKKHSNLILIEHEVNKKLGTARNTGRLIARGKYIWNIDSDDYIKSNILERIINLCINDNLDVLIFNFDHNRHDIEKRNSFYPFTNSQVMTGVEFINQYCLDNFHEISPIWTQVYKKEFLDTKGIFSPPINMGEDVPFTLKALLLAEKIKSITDSCYIYRLNVNSLGGTIEVIPQASKLYEKCFVCTRHVQKLLKLIPKDEKRIRNEYLLVCKYILSLYPQYLKKMSQNELNYFRTLGKTDIIRNRLLYLIMGKRKTLNYFKFLFINKL